MDQYFAGAGKRGHTTVRKKIISIDLYFAFLEQRYAGEIRRRFGAVVESPVDAFNRPRHCGDFRLRIPPSRAEMTAFYGRRRLQRKRREAIRASRAARALFPNISRYPASWSSATCRATGRV
ncbi:hypothetical protein [Streptomyces sp. NPDC050982]|uniref:hypothetical protein n=1 Tax=Streptomyces sp. NPDC050982 TaxID=3154746 RepID=UPI0033EF2F0A